MPREQNKVADSLSRYVDDDDWSISEDVFASIDKVWGAHTVDRFASNYNTKCVVFNSKFWCPGTAAVDAFSQAWGGVNNWLVPPPNVILRVLKKMRIDRAKGTLVVPMWRSAPFWPCIKPNGINFASFICSSIVLPRDGIIVKGQGRNGIFNGINPLKFSMVALRVDYSNFDGEKE